MFVTKLVAVLNARAGGTAGDVGRVQEEGALEALQAEEAENGDAAEREQRQRVDRPRLLASGIDADEAIDRALDRQEDAITEARSAIEDAREIRPEQPRRDEDATTSAAAGASSPSSRVSGHGQIEHEVCEETDPEPNAEDHEHSALLRGRHPSFSGASSA